VTGRNVFWRSSAKRREPAQPSQAQAAALYTVGIVIYFSPPCYILQWPALYTYLLYVFSLGFYFLFENFLLSFTRCPWKKGRKNKTTGDPELSVLSSISIQQLQQKNLFHSCLKKIKQLLIFFFFKTWERHVWNEMIPIWLLDLKTTLDEMFAWCIDCLIFLHKFVNLFIFWDCFCVDSQKISNDLIVSEVCIYTVQCSYINFWDFSFYSSYQFIMTWNITRNQMQDKIGLIFKWLWVLCTCVVVCAII
jgi:hypothetical protein